MEPWGGSPWIQGSEVPSISDVSSCNATNHNNDNNGIQNFLGADSGAGTVLRALPHLVLSQRRDAVVIIISILQIKKLRLRGTK